MTGFLLWSRLGPYLGFLAQGLGLAFAYISLRIQGFLAKCMRTVQTGWPSRVRTVVGQALLTPFDFLLAYQNDASRALQKVTKVTLLHKLCIEPDSLLSLVVDFNSRTYINTTYQPTTKLTLTNKVIDPLKEKTISLASL